MEHREDWDRERICACALGQTFGYKPVIARSIVEQLGSAAAAFDLDREQRTRIGIPDGAEERAARELERLEKRGCRFLAFREPGFPALLRDCPDAPAGLYVRSETPPEALFNRGPAIAVVGTRDLSLYGKEWCPRLVRAIARGSTERTMIVSGLALGIDICAHLAALSDGLPTVAVLPTGIDEVYPHTHRAAAERIAAAPGSALVTDYPPGTSPQPFTFLRRNRIIAGLSRATILVESRAKGGGTLTARLAAGYGREVYAVPGRIDDLRSAGCNRLISEKVAEIIPSEEDLPRTLGLCPWDSPQERSRRLLARVESCAEGPEREALLRLARLVERERGRTAEELAVRLGVPLRETVRLAGLLETEGVLTRDLLGRYRMNGENV